MSGHSKWANIKHKKAAADAKRGKVFSKIAKEIMVAARVGGGDPAANITLRALVHKARAFNMPTDNIERAIKKGTGELGEGALEEVIYEGYAPGGTAVIIQVLTDNRNRSAAEVRYIFTKYNGNLSKQGSVSHAFQRQGLVLVPVHAIKEEQLMELLLEAGAEDMKKEGDSYEIITDPSRFMDVVDTLDRAQVKVERSEMTFLPDIYVPIQDHQQAATLLRFIEELEDLDDVQNVYANFDMDDALIEALNEE